MSKFICLASLAATLFSVSLALIEPAGARPLCDRVINGKFVPCKAGR